MIGDNSLAHLNSSEKEEKPFQLQRFTSWVVCLPLQFLSGFLFKDFNFLKNINSYYFELLFNKVTFQSLNSVQLKKHKVDPYFWSQKTGFLLEELGLRILKQYTEVIAPKKLI